MMYTPTHTYHVLDNELPTFPVDPSYLAPLRDRVRLARQIVSMEQSRRKVSRGNKWALQVAKAMEIEVEEDMYPTLMAMIMNLAYFRKSQYSHEQHLCSSPTWLAKCYALTDVCRLAQEPDVSRKEHVKLQKMKGSSSLVDTNL